MGSLREGGEEATRQHQVGSVDVALSVPRFGSIASMEEDTNGEGKLPTIPSVALQTLSWLVEHRSRLLAAGLPGTRGHISCEIQNRSPSW